MKWEDGRGKAQMEQDLRGWRRPREAVGRWSRMVTMYYNMEEVKVK